MNDQTLFLNQEVFDKRSITYRLHPVVVIAILDHYPRRDPGQESVIGCLLGKRGKKDVQITNSFPIKQMTSRDGEFTMQEEYITDVIQLHQAMNKDEQVVGWYSTGFDIKYADVDVHKFINQKRLEFAPDDSPLVHVVIDTALTDNRLGIKAYVAEAITSPLPLAQFQQDDDEDQQLDEETDLFYMFNEVPLELQADESEKIAVDVLIKAPVLNADVFDSPAQISSDMDNLDSTLLELHLSIAELSKFVQRVQDGEVDNNVSETIGWMIKDAISSVPLLNPANYQHMFESSLRDILMLLYIANLTSGHITVKEKKLLEAQNQDGY